MGTVLVRDIFTGVDSSYPLGLTNIGGRVYFSAYSPTTGRELWSSNGTAAGTVLESDINTGPASSAPASILSLNGLNMAIATNNSVGREWFVQEVLVAAAKPHTPRQ